MALYIYIYMYIYMYITPWLYKHDLNQQSCVCVPFHRGRPCLRLRHNTVTSLRYLCPIPTVQWAPQNWSVESKNDEESRQRACKCMYYLYDVVLFVTGSQSPSSLWLILVNPVVKMFPSLVKMALIGRIPSCGARRSCRSDEGQTRVTSSFTFLNLFGVNGTLCASSTASGFGFKQSVHNL